MSHECNNLKATKMPDGEVLSLNKLLLLFTRSVVPYLAILFITNKESVNNLSIYL